MKKNLLFIVIGLTLLWCPASYSAGPAGSLGESDGANNNPHNLSSLSGNAVRASDAASQTYPGKESQICIFCHTPHGATLQSTLWNRTSPDNMGSFLIRPGLKISDNVVGGVQTTHYGENANGYEYPNGTSKLCLSCHDGVTAIGALSSGDMIDMTVSTLELRTTEINLSISHPISFIYNSDVVGYLGASYHLPPTGYLDMYDRVQCTICHQPHQDTRGTGTNLPFWRYGTGNQATDYAPVCVSCHTGTPPLPGGGPEHQYNP